VSQEQVQFVGWCRVDGRFRRERLLFQLSPAGFSNVLYYQLMLVEKVGAGARQRDCQQQMCDVNALMVQFSSKGRRFANIGLSRVNRRFAIGLNIHLNPTVQLDH